MRAEDSNGANNVRNARIRDKGRDKGRDEGSGLWQGVRAIWQRDHPLLQRDCQQDC
jgi:hypothetical protein